MAVLERNGAGKIIIYTNERKDAGSLERDLAAFRQRSISVRKLMGGMTPTDREDAFKQLNASTRRRARVGDY